MEGPAVYDNPSLGGYLHVFGEWAVVGDGGSITDGGIFTASTLAGEYPDTIKASAEVGSHDLDATGSVTSF